MDALTLYILVRLAGGEAHIALKEPLNGRTCERARIDEPATKVMGEQLSAKPKLVYLFCTDASGRPPATYESRPGASDQSDLVGPDSATHSLRQASP